jgi:hypothetical protein
MEKKEAKTINYYMRIMHRYAGFFVVGLTLVYGISGIVMVYRDTDFLKQDKFTEKQLKPNIKESELGSMLRIKKLEISKTEGNIVYFKNGQYNKETGLAQYTEKSLPAILEKFNGFHKTVSKNSIHYATVTFATLLLFLAISSFWMFKPKTRIFKKGIITAGIGFLFAVILLLL